MPQLLSNLPIGSKIKFGKHQVNTEAAQPIVWLYADKNHSGYPSNSLTLVTEKSIDLRASDSTAVGYDDNYDYADMEYDYSNINQWLNSSASAGKWWVSQYRNDTAPDSSTTKYGTGYKDRTGFLYNFTEFERNALLPTTITVQAGESNTTKITVRVFLPSTFEMIGTGAITDNSSQLSYFKSNTAKCGLTSQAYNNTLSSLKPSSLTSYWAYHTRNAYGLMIRGISEEGVIKTWTPNDGSKGIRPIINLAANTKITDTPDSDGCYNVLPQSAPVISGSNTDLGTITNGFSQTYTVDDGDNEPVTVKEYVDNVLIRSYVPTLGATNTMVMTGASWLKLANGTHTIKIVATDGIDEVTRTYTFTKALTSFVVQRATPIIATEEPKSIIVTVVKVIPEEATFKVEACRNGFDTSPYWEDITSRVIAGRAYDFDLTHTKSATEWGINVRVTVDRNGAAGACYITEIGGNFE